jgi:hypothetical protein
MIGHDTYPRLLLDDSGAPRRSYSPGPHTRPPLRTARKTGPLLMLAAWKHFVSAA